MCIYDMICDRELLYCFAWAIKVNLLCAFANVYRPPLKRPLLYFLGYLLKRLALDILPSAIVTGLTGQKKKDKFKVLDLDKNLESFLKKAFCICWKLTFVFGSMASGDTLDSKAVWDVHGNASLGGQSSPFLCRLVRQGNRKHEKIRSWSLMQPLLRQ